MSQRIKWILLWSLVAAGLVLGFIGWFTDLYSETTGIVLMISLVIVHLVLRFYWGTRSK